MSKDAIRQIVITRHEDAWHVVVIGPSGGAVSHHRYESSTVARAFVDGMMRFIDGSEDGE